MMERYINANLLLQQVAHINSTVEQGVKYFNAVYNLILKQPTADVEEVKHGEWIVVGRTKGGSAILKCSHCGRVRKGHGKSAFCCDCGAKMK